MTVQQSHQSLIAKNDIHKSKSGVALQQVNSLWQSYNPLEGSISSCLQHSAGYYPPGTTGNYYMISIINEVLGTHLDPTTCQGAGTLSNGAPINLTTTPNLDAPTFLGDVGIHLTPNMFTTIKKIFPKFKMTPAEFKNWIASKSVLFANDSMLYALYNIAKVETEAKQAGITKASNSKNLMNLGNQLVSLMNPQVTYKPS